MKPSKNLMLAMATKKEITNPMTKTQNWSFEKEFTFFTKSSPVAPSIVGTASKKENSTMVFLFKPVSNPPTMVAAERDIPGIIAIDWQRPIQNDCLYEI